jgi:hypothetical protein
LAGTADPGEQDLLASTQGKTRRVRPEFINYTKRAKRVDVRKLKDNIWKGLKIPTLDEQQPANPEAMMVRDIPSGLSRDSLVPLNFGRTLTLTAETRRRWVSQIPRERARSTK